VQNGLFKFITLSVAKRDSACPYLRVNDPDPLPTKISSKIFGHNKLVFELAGQSVLKLFQVDPRRQLVEGLHVS